MDCECEYEYSIILIHFHCRINISMKLKLEIDMRSVSHQRKLCVVCVKFSLSSQVLKLGIQFYLKLKSGMFRQICVL